MDVGYSGNREIKLLRRDTSSHPSARPSGMLFPCTPPQKGSRGGVPGPRSACRPTSHARLAAAEGSVPSCLPSRLPATATAQLSELSSIFFLSVWHSVVALTITLAATLANIEFGPQFGGGTVRHRLE